MLADRKNQEILRSKARHVTSAIKNGRETFSTSTYDQTTDALLLLDKSNQNINEYRRKARRGNTAKHALHCKGVLDYISLQYQYSLLLELGESFHSFSHKLVISFLHGPPGKIIRKFSYGPLRYLWNSLDYAAPCEVSTGRNIDYSLIEVEDMGVKASHLKATKADDAPVDFELWAWPNESELETFARNFLRLACFTFWKLNLVREAFRWLNYSPDSIPSERMLNKLAIIDCLTRSSNSTLFWFWEWDDGSRLFFWRWQHWWKSARDGEILFHETDPPHWMGRNLPAPSPHYETLLRKKEAKLVHRRYLEFGFVDSIVPRFGVPKGEDDIRLVWDATRCGANETVWAPSFWMPVFRTISDLIIKRLPCSVSDYFSGRIPTDPSPSDWRVPHQSDMDVGEMFLNYMLHYSERHFFGARIVTGEGETEVCRTMRFQRLLFGGRPCPFLAVQGHARAIELIPGDIADTKNALGWTRVITNWPFDFGYDPSMPRVIRVRHDGEMAPGYPAFVDDGRISGVSKQICDSATHRFCTKVNYLGEQNASRKRRPASTTPGAWTGKMLWTHESHPIKGILPEKWKIQRDGLLALKALIDEGSPVERKLFMSVTCRGMSQTEVYWDLRPYYKSFYNALEAWRSNRDEEGWKMDDPELETDDVFDLVDDNSSVPTSVDVTAEVKRDLEALLLFYESEEPVFLPVRPQQSTDLAYMGGDASAAAYGTGVQDPNGKGTVWLGNWRPDETSKGSNWREAANLARILLMLIRAGKFDGKEIWMATDNLVWALISNKGMSKRKGL
eukprot:scaffold132204_cov35-Cyclotella_meneghiniana.AAC.1